MPEATAQRQCGSCYFACKQAGRRRCVREAPALDSKEGAARWPAVKRRDVCARFRYADGALVEADSWPRSALPIYADAEGDYCRIPLTQGRFAKVDPEDYLWLAQSAGTVTGVGIRATPCARCGPEALHGRSSCTGWSTARRDIWCATISIVTA